MHKELKTPYLTTDGIIEIFDKNDTFLGIVIIKRKNPPYGYALPGGFVDIGESVEEALKREMKEETNLNVEITKLLGVYSNPNRDPRFHTVSVVYVAKAYEMPKAGDDAKEAKVIMPYDIDFKEIVFDHAKIIQDYLKAKK